MDRSLRSAEIVTLSPSHLRNEKEREPWVAVQTTARTKRERTTTRIRISSLEYCGLFHLPLPLLSLASLGPMYAQLDFYSKEGQ